MKRIAPPLICLLIGGLPLSCTTNDDGKTNLPATIFDSTPPNPKKDQVKIDNFIVQLEQKYKRESVRNKYDLHFSGNGPGRIKIRVSYERTSDPTTANSIATAAVDLVKRLKGEDPEVRDIDIILDRVVEFRSE